MKKKIVSRTISVFCIVLITVIVIFLDAFCNAEQLVQTDSRKSVFEYNTSTKPDYVIALEKGDYKSAIKKMRSLAEKGDPYVQYNLGLLYYRGTAGLPQNYKEAEKLWRKSAERGLIAAQSGLAQIYEKAKGMDHQESIEWYRKAAKRKVVFAYYFLGCFYAEGYGVVKDYKEAVEWFRKAADQDFIFAQINLGNIYIKGRGVPRNYQEAFSLYHKAAVGGADIAQISLGTMYFKGDGVAQDYVQAYKWFYIASATSDKRFADIAKEAIELTSKHLNRKQITEAIRLAKEEKITKIDVLKAFEK
ncbi:MAG: sel1 repeat family protein [Deltaproteobacteria bacterium]|nr:sel1 repeat family protein [Deltaproteobacteria bacterium]